MLVVNFFGENDSKDKPEKEEPEYPDEVLESEWNPALIEVHSRIISDKSSDSSEAPSDKDSADS
jgi:hypothetical protein